MGPPGGHDASPCDGTEEEVNAAAGAPEARPMLERRTP